MSTAGGRRWIGSEAGRYWLALVLAQAALAGAVEVSLADYRPGPVKVERRDQALAVEWNDEAGKRWRALFSLDPDAALVREISSEGKPLLRDARPVYSASTAKRRGGWDAFFDHPGRRPEEIHHAGSRFRPAAAQVRTIGNRVEIHFDGLEMGLFSGGIAYTFYPGSRLIRQDAVVGTSAPDVAYYYDAGIRVAATGQRLSWYDTGGVERTAAAGPGLNGPLQVRYRTLAAEWTGGGSMAVFPPPHQYFFARDVTNNLGYMWRRWEQGSLEVGIRQLGDDGTRYYPWMNAPPGTEQRLGMFLVVGAGGAAGRLAEVLRYTSGDRFPPLAGYRTMATHWHFGYAVTAMREGFDKTPFFKPVLKQMGVDIAMIMDFHGDGHPADTGQVRLEEMDALFRGCREQSDGEFLILPAEEANVHLGGHWALFFPKPVYWHQRRPEGRAFVTDDPKRGKVYATGSATDMLEVVRREGGFMWQTHPRTKGSTGYPDVIRNTAHFLDPRWLGGGWKQMPSDLSSPRLGERGFRLLDDMNNWGLPKRLLGEVDVFKIDETHELYSHMNVNYLRLASLPSFDDYTSVARAMEKGEYFVTTGEVLIPEHSFEARAGGTRVRAQVRWTFPLKMAEVVWGDGVYTKRHTIGLEETAAFGQSAYDWQAPAAGWTWMRLAVWDVAGNGAFTMPVRRDVK